MLSVAGTTSISTFAAASEDSLSFSALSSSLATGGGASASPFGTRSPSKKSLDTVDRVDKSSNGDSSST
jgi:hypothetical protein